MNRAKSLAMTAAAVGLTVILLAVGAVAGGPDQPRPPSGAVTRGAASPLVGVVSRGGADVGIRGLQVRLKRVPGDWSGWSDLGALYTVQARLTADPSFYARAEGGFARSLMIRPRDNAGALTGKAALAASRHDFVGALVLARASERVNAYSASNLGVLFDALSELGRYPQAFVVLQRMVDLKPGVASYARVSYAYELRGDGQGAKFALTRALEVSAVPADIAFVRQYLGELAFSSGDLAAAESHFVAGLGVDPTYVPLLAGRARVAAARGQGERAVRQWQEVTTRLPQTTYLIEYADVLASLGRERQAKAQYAIVEASARLFRSQGANVDLELSLFDADHSRGARAVAAAGAEQARRRSVHVEDAYGWALHAVGRDRQALVHAKAAARLGMRNALFFYHRGMIEKSLGLRAASIASLRQALSINPYFSPLQAPQARKALAELEGGR